MLLKNGFTKSLALQRAYYFIILMKSQRTVILETTNIWFYFVIKKFAYNTFYFSMF